MCAKMSLGAIQVQVQWRHQGHMYRSCEHGNASEDMREANWYIRATCGRRGYWPPFSHRNSWNCMGFTSGVTTDKGDFSVSFADFFLLLFGQIDKYLQGRAGQYFLKGDLTGII